MFDNLKEKLGSFRSEAEEAAEAKAEPVDEAATEALEDDDGDPENQSTDTDESAAFAEDGEADGSSTGTDANDAVDADVTATATATQSDGDGSSAAAVVTEASETHIEPDAEDASGDTPAAPSEAGHEAAETEAEDEEDDGDDAADDENDDNGTGFASKARSLVRGKFVIEEDDLEGPLQELELALLSSDVEMGVAEEILDNIRDELIGETRTFTTSTGSVVEEALGEAIHDVISVGQFDFDDRIAIEETPFVIIFTGVNGVGKTTSIAKMDRYLEERGFSTVMANGDTYRAGANEQIAEHADARGTKLITHDQGGDPAAVLYDAVEYAEANDVDVVLGDTAGRLHTNEGLMDQLEKIERVVGPDMTLFVDEAVAGQDAVNRAREFNEAAEIDGAILTKADADSNGGAAISIAHVTGKPILFLGVGQGYADLERFDPDEMVERLLAEE